MDEWGCRCTRNRPWEPPSTGSWYPEQGAPRNVTTLAGVLLQTYQEHAVRLSAVDSRGKSRETEADFVAGDFGVSNQSISKTHRTSKWGHCIPRRYKIISDALWWVNWSIERGSDSESFADNLETRYSSQGYAFKLFGGLINWRANKQKTVTLSSTEAELLSIFQVARETL